MTRRPVAAAVAGAVGALLLAGCAGPATPAATPSAAAPMAAPTIDAPTATVRSASPVPTTATPGPATPSASTPPAVPAVCTGSAWTCAQQRRFAAVETFVRREVGPHGHLGVVFTDRRTGAVWRTGDTAHAGWTASTIKLAIASDLLGRARTGAVVLTAADRHDLATMLNFSDEAASDRLWRRFGGDAMLARFRADLGMTGLRFVPGFTATTYWGFVRCTTDDLAALVGHVLAGPDRAYLVAAMRGVASNQRWGVWGAGAAQRPGNKDGWSFESDPYGRHWVTDTVGFAGPDERFTVAVMYQVDPAGSLADGVHAVSDVSALLFGRPVPAPVTVPAPDG